MGFVVASSPSKRYGRLIDDYRQPMKAREVVDENCPLSMMFKSVAAPPRVSSFLGFERRTTGRAQERYE